MEPAPIALFVYNRIVQTQKTVTALQNNEMASASHLYIFSDGAKKEEDKASIQDLREYLTEIQGFKSVTVLKHELNLGLAKSIVFGISQVFKKYNSIIVLEDDVVTSPYFLRFMNDSLNCYAEEEKVMHVSGYMYPHKKKLPDTFFYNVPVCWGWSTWKRAWHKYNDNVDHHIKYLNKNKLWKKFNKFGGNYLGRQLKYNKTGKLRTWFIFWHSTIFSLDGFCLFPNQTLVHNIGFDSSGQHGANTDKFYSIFPDVPFEVNEQPLIENKSAGKIIKHFYLIKRNSYVRKIKSLIAKTITWRTAITKN